MSASFPTIIETVHGVYYVQPHSSITTTNVAVRTGEVFCCFKITTVIMSRTLKYSSYYHTFKEIVLEEQFANPIYNPKQASPYGFLSEW